MVWEKNKWFNLDKGALKVPNHIQKENTQGCVKHRVKQKKKYYSSYHVVKIIEETEEIIIKLKYLFRKLRENLLRDLYIEINYIN